MLDFLTTIRAAGWGIISALTSTVPGFLDVDVPSVHGALDHTLLGIGVGLLVYYQTEKAKGTPEAS